MFLTIRGLFRKVHQNQDGKLLVKISYLEVYNETIRDLLTSSNSTLDLRQDPLKGICVSGLSEVVTSSTEEVITMLK